MRKRKFKNKHLVDYQIIRDFIFSIPHSSFNLVQRKHQQDDLTAYLLLPIFEFSTNSGFLKEGRMVNQITTKNLILYTFCVWCVCSDVDTDIEGNIILR